MLPSIIASSLAIKAVLMRCYHSTDFEVHRNWMAIVYNLPPSEWYFNSVSMWTLDYPPFFAYFEWLLAHIAVHVDPTIVTLSATPVLNDNVLLFQRCSVVITEFVLLWATWRFAYRNKKDTINQKETVFTLVALNSGLILVDHIHFQYNGLLLGLLVLCFDAASREQGVLVAVYFSILVLSKHLFLTLAPVFAAYLWQSYCTDWGRRKGHTFTLTVVVRFALLVAIALLALFLCFGPVLLWDNSSGPLEVVLPELKRRAFQIVSRLFPFGRGLVHSYWAPNVWALYYFTDRVANAVLGRMNLLSKVARGKRVGSASSTVSGLVGGVSPTVLPDATAPICMALVFLFSLPALYRIFTAPKRDRNVSLLVKAVVYTSLTAFMLGYHVHEKAILVPLVAQTFLLLPSGHAPDAFSLYTELAAAGTAALLPLFTSTTERWIKVVVFATFLALVMRFNNSQRRTNVSVFVVAATGYMVVLTELFYPYLVIQKGVPQLAAFAQRYQFLPLLVISVTSAIFLVHAWHMSYRQLVYSE